MEEKPLDSMLREKVLPPPLVSRPEEEEVVFLLSAGSDSFVWRELRRSIGLLKVEAFGIVEVPLERPPPNLTSIYEY